MSLRIDTTNLLINRHLERLLALVKSSRLDLFTNPSQNTFYLALADSVLP